MVPMNAQRQHALTSMQIVPRSFTYTFFAFDRYFIQNRSYTQRRPLKVILYAQKFSRLFPEEFFSVQRAESNYVYSRRFYPRYAQQQRTFVIITHSMPDSTDP